MWEFLRANWLWILLGVSLLFMFRMHGAGGCGMGHGGHGGHRHEDETSENGDAAGNAGHGSAGTRPVGDGEQDATSKAPVGRRHGGR